MSVVKHRLQEIVHPSREVWKIFNFDIKSVFLVIKIVTYSWCFLSWMINLAWNLLYFRISLNSKRPLNIFILEQMWSTDMGREFSNGCLSVFSHFSLCFFYIIFLMTIFLHVLQTALFREHKLILFYFLCWKDY